MKYFMIAAWKLVLMNREEKQQWLGKNIEKNQQQLKQKRKFIDTNHLKEKQTDGGRMDRRTDTEALCKPNRKK